MEKHTGGGNVLRQELAVTVREHSTAPAPVVFDVLANLRGHLRWGGAEASTLLSVAAPEGEATAGTEFGSTAEDGICRMQDSSVVTEAVRPWRFEKVTESKLESKKNGTTADWLLVHRYEFEADGDQCDVTYTCRLARASGLPGPLAAFGIPVLRSLASREWARASRVGLRRLVAAAEILTQAAPASATRREQDDGKAND